LSDPDLLKKHRLPKFVWLLHTLKKLIKSHLLRQDLDPVLDVRIRPKRSRSATLLKGQYISVAESHHFYASSAPGKNLNAAPVLTQQSVFWIRFDTDLFWSDPYPDVWERIRILALRNYPILTFLVFVKAIQESLFNFLDHILEHIFIKKISRKMLAKNLCRSDPGSVTGSGRF
jgi:hypothetical protein